MMKLKVIFLKVIYNHKIKLKVIKNVELIEKLILKKKEKIKKRKIIELLSENRLIFTRDYFYLSINSISF